MGPKLGTCQVVKKDVAVLRAMEGTCKTALATGAACILAVRTQHCHVMSCARLQLCLLKQENSQIPHAQQGLWRLWRWIKPQSPWPVGALLPAGDVASTPTREPTEEAPRQSPKPKLLIQTMKDRKIHESPFWRWPGHRTSQLQSPRLPSSNKRRGGLAVCSSELVLWIALACF